MIRKALVVLALVSLTAGVSLGESSRLMLSVENKMPELHRLELGVLGIYEDVPAVFPAFSDAELYGLEPYARFGLFRNFTVFTRVPYVSVEPDVGETTDGLGDVSAGFELVAFEDYFDFPYIIPHAEAIFDTADEGLGYGETRLLGGVAIGTVVDDQWHYVVDIGYMTSDDEDDLYRVSGGFVWDLNKQCSLLAEGIVTGEDYEDNSYTLYGQGGITYRPFDELTYVFYAGTGDATDFSAALKIAYSF